MTAEYLYKLIKIKYQVKKLMKKLKTFVIFFLKLFLYMVFIRQWFYKLALFNTADVEIFEKKLKISTDEAKKWF